MVEVGTFCSLPILPQLDVQVVRISVRLVTLVLLEVEGPKFLGVIATVSVEVNEKSHNCIGRSCL